jgi:transcriptional regulator with XRE-family HTH domain
MRPSPLRHPVAVLRTTIGLTQKELADLVDRAARTIQSIELGQLPLSEELALRIAKESGVVESWLLQGDTGIPPQRGKALLAFSEQRRPYRREDYEWQRAFNEAPAGPEAELAGVVKQGPKRKGGDLTLTLAQAKAAVLAAQPVMLESMDEKLLGAMASFLKQTRKSADALLVRWKLRRLLETLARERAIELPPRDLWAPTLAASKSRRKRTNISVKR